MCRTLAQLGPSLWLATESSVIWMTQRLMVVPSSLRYWVCITLIASTSHWLYCIYIFVAGRGQQISNTHDTYLISAESAGEADDWVAAIRRVMHEVWLPLLVPV